MPRAATQDPTEPRVQVWIELVQVEVGPDVASNLGTEELQIYRDRKETEAAKVKNTRSTAVKCLVAGQFVTQSANRS